MQELTNVVSSKENNICYICNNVIKPYHGYYHKHCKKYQTFSSYVKSLIKK